MAIHTAQTQMQSDAVTNFSTQLYHQLRKLPTTLNQTHPIMVMKFKPEELQTRSVPHLTITVLIKLYNPYGEMIEHFYSTAMTPHQSQEELMFLM